MKELLDDPSFQRELSVCPM